MLVLSLARQGIAREVLKKKRGRERAFIRTRLTRRGPYKKFIG